MAVTDVAGEACYHVLDIRREFMDIILCLVLLH